MNVSGFNHLTLRVTSLNRSLPFYTDILGMTLVHRGRTDSYLEWGSAWICLLERSAAPSAAALAASNSSDDAANSALSSPHSGSGGENAETGVYGSGHDAAAADGPGLDHAAFTIAYADFSDAVERLKQFQVPIVRGPVLRGGGWSVNFLDPDGIQLELFTGTLAERMKDWR
ncbi:VOC family protein [Paenibacillus piri]|nr:VOC family protein [Paenibacillus piri]